MLKHTRNILIILLLGAGVWGLPAGGQVADVALGILSICLIALFFWRPSPMLLLMAFLAAPQVWKAWKFDPNSEEAKTYYAVSAAKKWEYGFMYLGLAAFLPRRTAG